MQTSEPLTSCSGPFIDRYVNQYRQVLARSDNPPSALWLSAKDGTPLTYNHVTDLINATTLATVGVKVSPHLFRTSAVSSAAIYAGRHPVSRQRSSAPHRSGPDEQALQPSNKFECCGKFPTNHSAYDKHVDEEISYSTKPMRSCAMSRRLRASQTAA